MCALPKLRFRIKKYDYIVVVFVEIINKLLNIIIKVRPTNLMNVVVVLTKNDHSKVPSNERRDDGPKKSKKTKLLFKEEKLNKFKLRYL